MVPVWKVWRGGDFTNMKSGSRLRMEMSTHDDRCMEITDLAASSIQLVEHWSTTKCVLLPASSIRYCLLYRRLRGRPPIYRIPFLHNHMQCTHEHIDWHANWQPSFVYDVSRFNLWYHHFKCYVNEDYLLECIIKHHNVRTPGVIMLGTIAQHERSQLLGILGNLNISWYINPKSFLPFKLFLQLSFYRILPAHILKEIFKTSCYQNTYRFFCNLHINPIYGLLNM